MTCRRAQQSMALALDEELSARRRRALDRHLASCEACRQEMVLSARLADALASLPMEADVSAQVEQATLRRVRAEADAEHVPRGIGALIRARWLTLSLPALAATAVVALAVGVVLRSPGPVASPPASHAPGRSPAVAELESPRAGSHGTPPSAVASARDSRTWPATPPPAAPPPAAPPPELAQAPELFVDLPILRNMDKLEHFDAILTTTIDDDDRGPGQEPPSNG
jgi:anti-sigma factor RsiW